MKIFKNIAFEKMLLREADNVYRTNDFIVLQKFIVRSNQGSALSMSYDTYYLRTPERDVAYNHVFKGRALLEGKRLRASTYIRQYVY